MFLVRYVVVSLSVVDCLYPRDPLQPVRKKKRLGRNTGPLDDGKNFHWHGVHVAEVFMLEFFAGFLSRVWRSLFHFLRVFELIDPLLGFPSLSSNSRTFVCINLRLFFMRSVSY